MCDYQEYQLKIDKNLHGQKLSFKEFSDLDIIYISSKNELCIDNYGEGVCIQAGHLEITLKIDGKLYIIYSDMKDKINVGEYNIKGIKPLVIDRSRDKTYMIMSIEKCEKLKTITTVKKVEENKKSECNYKEYQIKINKNLHNTKLTFNEFPDLDIIYVEAKNNLCPSYYSSAKCFWAGNLTIIFRINGKNYIITSNMKEKINVGEYNIKGINQFVIDKSKDKTYIVISIEKCKEKSKSYNLGQPFTMDFNDNPSTGYSWKLELTPGLKINEEKYSHQCQEGITGCGGIRTFILEGTQKGTQKITAIHGRPWDHTTNTKYEYVINIM